MSPTTLFTILTTIEQSLDAVVAIVDMAAGLLLTL